MAPHRLAEGTALLSLRPAPSSPGTREPRLPVFANTGLSGPAGERTSSGSRDLLGSLASGAPSTCSHLPSASFPPALPDLASSWLPVLGFRLPFEAPSCRQPPLMVPACPQALTAPWNFVHRPSPCPLGSRRQRPGVPPEGLVRWEEEAQCGGGRGALLCLLHSGARGQAEGDAPGNRTGEERETEKRGTA